MIWSGVEWRLRASVIQWAALIAVPMPHNGSWDFQVGWLVGSSRLQANLWLLGGNTEWMGLVRRLGHGANKEEVVLGRCFVA